MTQPEGTYSIVQMLPVREALESGCPAHDAPCIAVATCDLCPPEAEHVTVALHVDGCAGLAALTSDRERAAGLAAGALALSIGQPVIVHTV